MTLEGILTELIVPAVKRKELLFREKGLTSLGLCCLIAKVCVFRGSLGLHNSFISILRNIAHGCQFIPAFRSSNSKWTRSRQDTSASNYI